MEGDEKVRFCSGCQQHVYNLSAMDVEEAAARVAEHSDDLCVRFFRRADGTLLTQDCSVGVEKKRRERRAAVKTIAILAVSAVYLVAPAVIPGAIVGKRMGRPLTREEQIRLVAGSGDVSELRALLDPEADVERPDGTATTLLMLAATGGNVDAVRYLLGRGADVGARDTIGRTPLSIAQEIYSLEIVVLLRNAGAKE
jgi:hypothetical protein